MRIPGSARWLVLAAVLAIVPASSYAGVFISVGIAPPVLPVYVQPECPEPGYIWTPGYWAYGDDGYYWVPGAWVPAPYEEALWTPPYWGWSDGVYVFHPGYWGRHVGYYGGINYGFGYFGVGFVGGEWHEHHFRYNAAVVNVNRTVIRDVYVNKTVINNTTIVNNRVAYVGGPGGIRHDPTPQEREAMHESHVAATPVQRQHFEAARMERANYFKANNGRPQNLAVARPLTSPVGANAGVHNNVQMSSGQPGRVDGNANQGVNAHPAPVQPGRPAPFDGHPRPMYQAQGPAAQQSHPAPQGQLQNRPQPPAQPQYRAPQQEQHPIPPAQPQYRPAPQQEQHPMPQAQPQYRAPQQQEQHPMPQGQPQYRPVPQTQPPQYRQAPPQQPQYRPEPQYRPAPQAQPHPMPQAQPQYRPQPQPQPQYRPAPQPQPHPMPQAQPQYRPMPQARPEPQHQQAPPSHESRPAPESRPREHR